MTKAPKTTTFNRRTLGKPLESGWVIENCKSDPSDPIYWCGGQWIRSDKAATRFCRECDASAVALDLLLNPAHRVSFHEWA